jgi:HK97 family phage portal protein
MKNYLTYFAGVVRFGKSVLSYIKGKQTGLPTGGTGDIDVPQTGVDVALQISAVWRAVEILSKLVSTMPLMVYVQNQGQRELARDTTLWAILHTTPNNRMTNVEFWGAMLLNLLLKGNAYARLERNAAGEVIALWPMPSEQVEPVILDDGTLVYHYHLQTNLAVLAENSVLHIKEMGNGIVGFSRLDYMRNTLGEARNAQTAANKLFANGGKPTGVLMVDNVLGTEQRQAVKQNFADMATGSMSRLYVIEANMKYQQINMSPEDMQLLATRKHTVEEIGRWFGVPAILMNQTEGTTTLGSSAADIIDSFHKLTIAPMVVNIEKALEKRVLTARQRARYTVEYNMDALLRANLKDRMEIYAKGVQNGIYNRNEARQLENAAPYPGGELYTAQSNLVPINMLGKVKPQGGNNATQDTIAQ